jgi:ZIP family zinc transporter
MTHEFFSPAVWTALAIAFGAGMATVIGSLLVVFFHANNTRLLAFGLAFSGGAMVYISLVEIFTKAHVALSEATDPKTGYAYATLFFFAGVALLFAVDRFIPNPHSGMDEADVRAAAKNPEEAEAAIAAMRLHSHGGHAHGHGLGHELGHAPAPAGAAVALDPSEAASRRIAARVGLLAAFAITAHNLPEGLATFFATLDNPSVGAALAAAIAVHNIPEGVSIAVPVYYATGSRSKAIWATVISGFAEPFGAIVGYVALAGVLSPFVFGAVFGVIAGAMVFLAIDELLPAARTYARGHETVYGMMVGMGVMALSLVLFK